MHLKGTGSKLCLMAAFLVTVTLMTDFARLGAVGSFCGSICHVCIRGYMNHLIRWRASAASHPEPCILSCACKCQNYNHEVMPWEEKFHHEAGIK
jgi:hypothetical protein